MADDTRKVRVEEQLKIKIAEAKNLQGRNNGGSNSGREVYCTIALDQEEIQRTATIPGTLSPLFLEEYQFEIPRKFRFLSLYVWEKDKQKQDKAIGKIAIKREEIHTYNNKDHWFALRPVDADSEVQGMIHIEVAVDEGNGSNLKRKSNFDESTSNLNSFSSNTSGGIEACVSGYNSNDYKENNLVTRSESVKVTSLSSSSSSSASVAGSVLSHSGSLGKTRTKFGQHTNELSLFNSQPSSKKSTSNIINALSSIRSDCGKSRVSISVVECCDLAKKNGNCDPYVMCTALYANKRVIQKRTKTRKKTVHPNFDEVFTFDLTVDCGNSNKAFGNNAYMIVPLDGADLCEVCVTVWHDGGGIGGDTVFLGEIKIPMRGKQQLNAVQPKAWYFLQPRTSHSRPARSTATPPGTRLSCDNSLGSMRLHIVYTSDTVFPLATYDDLLNMLLESLNQRPITISAVYILGEIIASKTDLAQPLVRLFTHKNLISPIIKALADHEISKLTDPTTIFRGNTLVSKMMDEAMRLSGLHYLHNTLRPIVKAIIHEKKPCEIDPARVEKNDMQIVEANLLNLEEYVEKVFEAITKSAVRCPAGLCQIFHDLRECAAKHFPKNKEVRYSVVSGFIFLRFFAPAILGPKLFDLTNEPLNDQTNRTLTLISKTIQSLGNLVSSRSAQQPSKEVYTGPLYKKFCSEKYVEAVKHFLEVVSSSVGSNPSENTLLEPVLLKEGLMTKRSQHQNLLGRFNFNQRYFRLTTQSLSYAKTKGKRLICDIPLSEILAVERLNECNFKMQNIFQIIRKERTLYVQTSNCVEEKEWVDLLSKITQSNTTRLENYHPCAYINGMWTCCQSADQFAAGCHSVSPKPLQMELATALDPARDLQRLNSLIMTHSLQLKQLAESETYNAPSGIYEDLPQTRNTAQLLSETANSLDQIQLRYKDMLMRETKYGSRQSPIGDDNYLHMYRGGGLSGVAAAAVHQHQLQHHQHQIHLHQHHHFHNDTSTVGSSGRSNYFVKNDLLRSSINNDKYSQC